MSDFLSICRERGFLHQCTDESGLADKLQPNLVCYTGYDCTGPSLHVGHLLPTMLLRWWQKCGHKPLVLMGGATTKIGDPSGKDASRQLLDDATIAANMASIRNGFRNLLEFEDSFDPTSNKAFMVNNHDWFQHIGLYEYLRDIGSHFTVNRMMAMESVKLRLDRESPLSLLEFNYMVFQSYDFYHLSQEYACQVQFGGSDQWGNITMGVDLARRLAASRQQPAQELYGATVPLLMTASGAKMGKTADGAVWLNADMLSPYAYWQYWRNCDDADVIRFLKLFTELPLEQIAEYETWQGSAQINDAKIILATEATALLHGHEAAEAAKETARQTFVEGASGADLPETTIATGILQAGIPAYQLFQQAGLAASGKEARRLIQGGGAKVNDAKIDDENQLIGVSDLTNGEIKLSAGKKKHVLVKAA
ncbi:MAG: tyrosine--tRNA ligase [Rickettsiales bacterium]|nr:tyrosine--tRNA ligase [Rickettsiales bacterium]